MRKEKEENDDDDERCACDFSFFKVRLTSPEVSTRLFSSSEKEGRIKVNVEWSHFRLVRGIVAVAAHKLPGRFLQRLEPG